MNKVRVRQLWFAATLILSLFLMLIPLPGPLTPFKPYWPATPTGECGACWLTRASTAATSGSLSLARSRVRSTSGFRWSGSP